MMNDEGLGQAMEMAELQNKVNKLSSQNLTLIHFKLECLKLAVKTSQYQWPIKNVINAAKEFEEYIMKD